MTNKASRSRHPHSFSTNFFGVLAYVGILGVWLLVLASIAIVSSLTSALSTVSTTINTTLSSDMTGMTLGTQTTQETVQDESGLRFVLFVILLIFAWLFAYFGAKVGSRVLRHFVELFGQKITSNSLANMKYLTAAVGLMGVTILLQFFPSYLSTMKLSIALLCFVLGIVAVGSIWVQKILVERHKIPLEQVL